MDWTVERGPKWIGRHGDVVAIVLRAGVEFVAQVHLRENVLVEPDSPFATVNEAKLWVMELIRERSV